MHYQNLQLYVSFGMKIKKVHRFIQFEQSCWMKPYIDLNIKKRKEATSRGDDAGKDLLNCLIMPFLVKLWRLFAKGLVLK